MGATIRWNSHFVPHGRIMVVVVVMMMMMAAASVGNINVRSILQLGCDIPHMHSFDFVGGREGKGVQKSLHWKPIALPLEHQIPQNATLKGICG
jgi:hypothetical protein